MKKSLFNIPVLLTAFALTLFIGCGGGSEPPPYEPTEEQKAALDNLQQAFNDLQQQIADGSACESPNGTYQDVVSGGGNAGSQYDRMLNPIMQYTTANNGASANQPGAMPYLYWHIQNMGRNMVNNFASTYQSLPLDEQGNVLACAAQTIQNAPLTGEFQSMAQNALSMLQNLPAFPSNGANPFAGAGQNPWAVAGGPMPVEPGGPPFNIGGPTQNPFSLGTGVGGSSGNPFGGSPLASLNPFGGTSLNSASNSVPNNGNPFSQSSTGTSLDADFLQNMTLGNANPFASSGTPLNLSEQLVDLGNPAGGNPF